MLQRRLNYISSRKASETIITLVFVCCESNPNTLVSKNFGNDHYIGFVLYESNLITLVSETSETISTLTFVHCETNLIIFVFKKDLP